MENSPPSLGSHLQLSPSSHTHCDSDSFSFSLQRKEGRKNSLRLPSEDKHSHLLEIYRLSPSDDSLLLSSQSLLHSGSLNGSLSGRTQRGSILRQHSQQRVKNEECRVCGSEFRHLLQYTRW